MAHIAMGLPRLASCQHKAEDPGPSGQRRTNLQGTMAPRGLLVGCCAAWTGMSLGTPVVPFYPFWVLGSHI